MAELDLSEVDVEDVLQRLVLFAARRFATLAGLATGGVIRGLGTGPDDLAMQTMLKFLDPEDRTVVWKTSYGRPTTEGLLRFLRKVLQNDLLDLLAEKAHETTVIVETLAGQQGEDATGRQSMSLDEFASAWEHQDERAIRGQQQDWLLKRFDDDPKLQDVLTAQFDPDGYVAHTNQQLAQLLGTTVDDIENRKKRIDRRLLKILTEIRETPFRERGHG